MAKSPNQKLKLLYLLKILEEKTDDEHGLTTQEIISILRTYDIEAERKSIYSDIEALEQFGIDIEKRKGASTTYHVVSRDFELPELKLLVDAIQSSKFLTHKKSSELIKKIEGLASKYEAKQLSRQVHVAGRIKTMNESIYYSVDDIHRAIGENRKISFRYYNWNMKKEKQFKRDGKVYNASPWALTWDDENYYLIAYDSREKKIKHYRVDKMLEIKVLDEERQGAEYFENFDMAQYSKKTFGMYGGRDEQVTLRCHESLAGVVVDRFGQDVVMYAVDDHHFEASVKVSVSPTFLGWIMNFGGNMKIMSPQSVIDDFINLAQNTISMYNK